MTPDGPDDRTSAEKTADSRDAYLHASWENQLARDPHRIRIDGITRAGAVIYKQWHTDRMMELAETSDALDAIADAFGRDREPRPLMDAQIAHHRTMIARLEPLAVQKPPKAAKRPGKPEDAAAVRRRQIHAYAHKHGLSDRAAEQHLNRSKKA